MVQYVNNALTYYVNHVHLRDVEILRGFRNEMLVSRPPKMVAR